MGYKYNPPSGWKPAATREEIATEFRRWNDQAGERVVSLDYDLPLAQAGQIEASVRFLLRGSPLTVKVAKWADFGTNLRCVYLLIRDMRLAEARGMTDAIREAYLQLPAPKTERDPFEVLGVRSDAPDEVIDGAYKAQSKLRHPDMATGSKEAMQELQAAYEKVKAERVTA